MASNSYVHGEHTNMCLGNKVDGTQQYSAYICKYIHTYSMVT